ncbi:hypothetical protein FRB99_006070 [Tulasnella sp. 403]|nr:hypothetical protein FRB99_006070 [Tulasnella sp. 403]
METPSSPSVSTVSFSEDDWDLLSDKSDPGRHSPLPIHTTSDYDSDGERGAHHAGQCTDPYHQSNPLTHESSEYVNDVASEISTYDELDADEGDDAVDDALLRESDRRVSVALANPLSSTLEPFREPLPDYISGSVSSSSTSALVLSFPDPLTPSQELQQAASKKPDELEHEVASVEPNVSDAPPTHEQQTDIAPNELADVTLQQPSVSAPIGIPESAAQPPPTQLEEIVLPHKHAGDLRKIASYIPRKKVMGARQPRRFSVNAISQMLQGPTVPHSWSTSIIVSLLAIVLGSALYASRTYISTSPIAKVAASGAPFLPATDLGASLTTTYTSICQQSVDQITPTVLLQTPGAGPSTVSTPGQRGRSSASRDTTNPPADAVKRKVDANTARASGTTRPGNATPSPVHAGLWGKGKGKEKEVVEVSHPTDADTTDEHAAEKPLLLEGPRSPLNLGYICRDVVRGFKSVLYDLPRDGRSRLGNDIFGLIPSIHVNIDELLDEMLMRLIDQTTYLLREISAIVDSAGHSLAKRAESILSSTPVQTAKEKLARHHSKVRSNTRRLVKGVHAHHKRARANARKGRKVLEKGLHAVKERAGVNVNAFVDGVKAHHKQARSNARKGRKLVRDRLNAVVAAGQRGALQAVGKTPSDESKEESLGH